MFDVLVRYNITLEELLEAKVSKIYYRIICEKGERKAGGVQYNKLHRDIFPTYMKTFNFKVHWDLLPVKEKFHNFTLDSREKITCPFCNLNLESAFHIFSDCKKLGNLWNFLDETLKVCFDQKCKYSFVKCRRSWNFSVVDVKCKTEYENLLLYLNGVVNKKIWKFRNAIFHEGESFEPKKLIKWVTSSMCARKNKDRCLDDKSQIKHIGEYTVTMCSIRDAMYDPG